MWSMLLGQWHCSLTCVQTINDVNDCEANLIMDLARARHDIVNAEKKLADCIVREHEVMTSLSRYKSVISKRKLDKADHMVLLYEMFDPMEPIHVLLLLALEVAILLTNTVRLYILLLSKKFDAPEKCAMHSIANTKTLVHVGRSRHGDVRMKDMHASQSLPDTEM
ncbi:uncharacterized protein F5147DRAFT_655588 [Suillus discolor]|uniref:Uncharacterized protein n=1 Tax=Suillus discolor TaxID=1912936 RepID=A0A9P7JQM6_9AGAM|nr:uncharacterized protein F5147DRAFT_655588 [Suillus discolor]KAG2100478.1 hypothetical protein F5147DRAFT_655588 [Suillus discolor]